MKPGDRVEVYQIWAANAPLRPPFTAWFKGYEFVESEGGVARVRALTGLYAGMVLNYGLRSVRKENTI